MTAAATTFSPTFSQDSQDASLALRVVYVAAMSAAWDGSKVVILHILISIYMLYILYITQASPHLLTYLL